MRRVLVGFGVDHARAPVAVRERIAFRADELPAALTALGQVVDEGLILSTCNRTEIYAVLAGDQSVADIRQFLVESRGIAAGTLDCVAYVHRDAAAVRHCFTVASGLDSMVLGEPQILGQLRAALAAAQADRVAQGGLGRLATDALRIGKRVRTETGLARNRLSIPHAAVALAASELPGRGGLAGRRALVIGAGKMATLTAKLLRRDGVAELLIANRTADRAAALAAAVGGRAVTLDMLPAALAGVDLAIGTAEVPAYVLTAGDLARMRPAPAAPLLLLDLAVPRSLDPGLAALPGVRLHDVDALEPAMAEARTRAAADIRAATTLIDAAVAEFMGWWQTRPVSPAIAALRRRSEQIRAAELERALRKLGHLSDRDREVVKALSVGIVNKLLHSPVTRLRHAEIDDPTVGAVMELFGLDPAVALGDERPAAAMNGITGEAAG